MTSLEPGALDRSGDGEHLAHSRATLGSLVADDHDVAGRDRAVLECVHRGAFAVEDPGGALDHGLVEAGALDDRALRCQRTVQDGDAAGRMDRL